MKTLNDKITVKPTISASIGDRYVSYYVTETTLLKAIFSGNVFIPASYSTTTTELFMNDILSSEHETPDVLDGNKMTTNYRPIRNYKVVINSSTYETGDVYIGYEYPFKSFDKNVLKGYDYCQTDDGSTHFSIMLQGGSMPTNVKNIGSQSYTLLPTYPYVRTDQLNFVSLFNLGKAVEDVSLLIGDEELTTVARYSYVEPYSASLSDLFEDTTYSSLIFAYNENVLTERKVGQFVINAARPIPIANVDECPADFYLQWFDRFGGVQCQPFTGKQTKSVAYSISNKKNRYGEKSPISLDNTYTFDLNTGWLSEDEYVLYESILVSPKLKLYDSVNDKSYDVIVADKAFTEKTYKNQKKMFGFNIKLQINNNENILY